MLLSPTLDIFVRPHEYDILARRHLLDQALEHRKPITTPDHLRVDVEVVDPTGSVGVRVLELREPDLVHPRCRNLLICRSSNELEVREVAEATVERDSDQIDCLAE